MGLKRREKAVFSCILPLAPPKPGERGRVHGEDDDWGWPWHSRLPMTFLSTILEFPVSQEHSFMERSESHAAAPRQGATPAAKAVGCAQGRSGAGGGRLLRGGWSPQDTMAEGGTLGLLPLKCPLWTMATQRARWPRFS